MRRLAVLAALVAAFAMVPGADARGPARVAVVASDEVRRAVVAGLGAEAVVLDAELVGAALAGAGYDGSVNLTLEEARRLARVAGADALVLTRVAVAERQSDNVSSTWDVAVWLLLVDGRTGELLRSRGARGVGVEREAASRQAAEAVEAEARGWGDVLRVAERRRLEGAARGWDPGAADLVSHPEGGGDLVPPRFFRRPSPAFTDEADRFRVVATVDLLVQFNADGTYGPIEVVRWAGFGLDEASIEAVRGATFWPARRAGRPVSARALLRYNFRFRDR